MTELDLAFNRLTTLPAEIGQLSALTKLNLSDNQLTTLPRELGQLSALTELYLHGNPALGIPEEVLGPSVQERSKDKSPAKPQAILDYYFGKIEGVSSVPPIENGEESSKPPLAKKQTPEKQFIEQFEIKPTVAVTTDLPCREATPTVESWVKGVSVFLLDANTKPPLTLSVEAPWGGGKSSAMGILRAHLDASGMPTVWFNPWRYEAGQLLWAAFAREFEEQLGARFTGCTRIWLRLSLGFRRLEWKEGLPLLMRLVAWVVVIGGLGWAMIHGWSGGDFKTWLKGGQGIAIFFGMFIAVVGLLDQVVKYIGNPLNLNPEKLFRRGTEVEDEDAVRRFHQDFQRMLQVYADPRRKVWGASREQRQKLFWHWNVMETFQWLFNQQTQKFERPFVAVFIDDLDRCEAPQSANLLQSLHLIMNPDGEIDTSDRGDTSGPLQPERRKATAGPNVKSEAPGLFYILGMDREKVAAAVACKHKDLLPFIPEYATTGEPNVTGVEAVKFGHEFLDKFINITLHLPRMRGTDLQVFMDGICGTVTPAEKAALPTSARAKNDERQVLGDEPAPERTAGKKTEPESVSTPEAVPEISEEVLRENVKTAADYPALLQQKVKMVAPLLENNPRKIKQFVNLFRMRLYLAASDGKLVLDPEPQSMRPGQLTASQLAKLVAFDVAVPEMMQRVRDRDCLPETLLQIINESAQAGALKAVWRYNAERDAARVLGDVGKGDGIQSQDDGVDLVAEHMENAALDVYFG